MMNEEQVQYGNYDSQGLMSSNEEYVQNQAFMLKRIDARPLIKDIENYLESKSTTLYEKDGEIVEVIKPIGQPLANKEGIMKICNIIRMRMNSQIVQGNLDINHYWDFLIRTRKELATRIVKKCYEWEILDEDLEGIIDEICAMIEIYLTRPIANEERKSYDKTVQAREVMQTDQKRSLGGFFRK